MRRISDFKLVCIKNLYVALEGVWWVNMIIGISDTASGITNLLQHT